MTAVSVSVEGLSPPMLEAYRQAGLDRGLAGPDAISWAFGGNGSPFAVARLDGRIEGISAYIQSTMKFGQAAGIGLQAVDSFVSQALRGKGIFTKLARTYDDHARQSGVDLVWGFPNDNAVAAWTQKLGWHLHGQVPFLVKPLRAGFFLRKLGLPLDYSVSFARDQNIAATREIGSWSDELWLAFSRQTGCSVVRDRNFLSHRLLHAPQADQYRVVADANPATAALVATREASKHGGRIAYLMEAMGGTALRELLMSEIGRLRARGVEMVLAWCFPWSPNYGVLRSAGFIPLPQSMRPTRIWFGTRPHTENAACSNITQQWYLSYLDSDTV